MTVRDLITRLLDCDMDSEVFLCDDVAFETENGKIDRSMYDIISVEPHAKVTFLNFNNRHHWKKVKECPTKKPF